MPGQRPAPPRWLQTALCRANSAVHDTLRSGRSVPTPLQSLSSPAPSPALPVAAALQLAEVLQRRKTAWCPSWSRRSRSGLGTMGSRRQLSGEHPAGLSLQLALIPALCSWAPMGV